MESWELLSALLARDEQAWRRFLTDYGRLIYAVSGRLGLSDAERDDHFQSVSLALYRGLPTLRDPERLSGWLYNIAYRAGIDVLRRRRPALDVSELDSEPALAAPDLSEDLERLQTVAQVRDALAGLEPRCRALLAALFLEDPVASYAEISRRVGIPIGSIGPTRSRCLEKLKNRLDELSGAGSPASTGRKATVRNNPSNDPREKKE